MKFLSRLRLLSLTFVALSCQRGDGLDEPSVPERISYQYAEYLPADLVLMHTPGEELFLGVMHPNAALFQYYMDIKKLQEEHINYRNILKSKGIKTLSVCEILLDGVVDGQGNAIEGTKLSQLRVLASQFLTYNTDRLSPELSKEQEAYKKEVLSLATPTDLVSMIMQQPTIYLYNTPTNTGIAATYVMNPIMNLYFTRDQLITTAKGTVMGRMNSPQREKECDIIEFCLRKIGINPVYKVAGEGAYLEGGDFLPFGNTAFIGSGMRTTQTAIDQLMYADAFGCDSVVVVKDKLFWQDQMHLDTYFNIIDKNLGTISANRNVTDPSSKHYVQADVYVRSGGQSYQKVRSNVPFLTLLKERNIELVAISDADRDNYANNYLCYNARQIMMVDGQSVELQNALSSKGVRVTWVPLSELRKGYGAAHCMTQVLSRRKY